ncbi:MAG: V-type ATP synthase subunit D, partial [Clostridia bacterium]|nr:V-type ATP synthase subunit D [Clostridia bacterium]
MSAINVNPTRMELKRLRARLSTARRGHKLLKDKRDELMKQFLDVIRTAKALREETEGELAAANKGFAAAASVTTSRVMTEALMLTKREGALDVSFKNIMSVNVPSFDFHVTDNGENGLNYGFAFTSGETDAAVASLSAILPKLIKLAEYEKTSQLLAEEIEKTRRRVNALEYMTIPQLEETIRFIKMRLEDAERDR